MGRPHIPPRVAPETSQPPKRNLPDPSLVVAILAFLGLLGWAIYQISAQGGLALF
jgi:hypothetical protein